MPVNGFNVGRDLALVINTSSGPLRLSLMTNFDAKPTVVDGKVLGMDGIVRHVIHHQGHQGTISIERQDSALDDYWCQQEEDYYSGFNNASGYISETITEANGSVSQYRYTGVVLKLTDSGKWSGDKTVVQTLEFMASRKKKVS